MSDVDTVRSFNRYYTRQIGVLQERLLKSPYSLAEARILYELNQAGTTTASRLAAELRLDPGYLSRILRKFKKLGLLTEEASSTDRRQRILKLTSRGRRDADDMDRRSRENVQEMLERLPADRRERLLGGIRTVHQALEDPAPATLIRSHRPGELSWVAWRHAVLYGREYGWYEPFEALVTRVVADFLQHPDPRREHCWIAELDGVPVGSVMLVRQNDEVCKLRLLFLEPSARGQGLGFKLVEQCLSFARGAGYRRMTLWTQEDLKAARRIYRAFGFRRVDRASHTLFGPEVVGETWELDL
ncbi:MAG: helix-turn-helix domain-containing GNAT family N-acetyltransferase [Candidatus Eremiobacterota bacterium]